MKDMYETKEMLHRQLASIEPKNGDLTRDDLCDIYHIVRSMSAIEKMENMAGGYSMDGGNSYQRRDSRGRYSREGDYSRDGYSREGGYSNRPYYSREDGYSNHGGHDGMIASLRQMLGDARDEKTRNAIITALNTIEK